VVLKFNQNFRVLVAAIGFSMPAGAALAADPTTETTAAAPASPPPSAAPALWEIGIAGAGSYLPDYPAAEQNHFKWIAAPYGVYRGRFVRADKDGARTRLIHTKVYEMDMSVAASFSSSAKDNDAREGMPDLDYLLELGPRLSFALSDLGGRGKLRLFAPLRAVFSTDLGDFQHRGYTAAPAINLHWFIRPHSEHMLFAQITSSFGNRQLNAYFYDVKPQFAKPDRAFYDARGGYIGSDFYIGMLSPINKHLRAFYGGQILNHSGAANETSPLFKNHFNYSGAVGLIWMMFESKTPAIAADE